VSLLANACTRIEIPRTDDPLMRVGESKTTPTFGFKTIDAQ
jgi:hypothetical protein